MEHTTIINNKFAYVSYMSNDRDIKGVLLLNYNLKKIGSIAPYYVIIIENVSNAVKQILLNNQINVLEYSFKKILLSYTHDVEHIDAIINKHYYGKFLIFFLTQFTHIIYLDTDLLLMVNIDHLFNDYIQIGQVNSISMVYDMNINKDKNNNILLLTINNAYNSGLIILKPDIKIAHILFNELVSYGVPWLNNNKTDQDVLNKIINSRLLNINVLQPKYNISPSLVNDMLNNKFFDKAYVIHYMLAPKPWDILDGVMDINNGYSNNVCQQLYKLWMNTYCDMTTEKYFCKKLTDSNLCQYYYNGIKDEANKRILLELPKNDSGYIIPSKPYIPDINNNIPQ